MTPAYSIREARWSDCGALARKAQNGRWLAYKAAGIDVRAKLRALWGASIIRKTWLVDGAISAMGGVTGSILSPTGGIWLLLAPEAERRRFAFLREAAAQLKEAARDKRELRITVAFGDVKSKRFAEWMGFAEETDAAGQPLRIQIGNSGVMIIPMVLR
jgi:hypothetical protein